MIALKDAAENMGTGGSDSSSTYIVDVKLSYHACTRYWSNWTCKASRQDYRIGLYIRDHCIGNGSSKLHPLFLRDIACSLSS